MIFFKEGRARRTVQHRLRIGKTLGFCGINWVAKIVEISAFHNDSKTTQKWWCPLVHHIPGYLFAQTHYMGTHDLRFRNKKIF